MYIFNVVLGASWSLHSRDKEMGNVFTLIKTTCFQMYDLSFHIDSM